MQQRRACRALGAALVALALATVSAVSEAAAPAEPAEDTSEARDTARGHPRACRCLRAPLRGELRNLAAEEAYRQAVRPTTRRGAGGGVRNMRSDVVFVRLARPDPVVHLSRRLLVDGWKVRDRDGAARAAVREPLPVRARAGAGHPRGEHALQPR